MQKGAKWQKMKEKVIWQKISHVQILHIWVLTLIKPTIQLLRNLPAEDCHGPLQGLAMTEKKKAVKNFDHLVHEKAGALRGGERPQRGIGKDYRLCRGGGFPLQKNCISSSYFCILLPTPEKVVLRIAIRASGAVLFFAKRGRNGRK